MGIPAPLGVAGSGVPPTGDQASVVVSGSLAAVGPGIPCPLTGNLNLSVWGSINTALTTTAGSLTASVVSGAGLAIGNAITSANLPPGTTIGNLAGTTVTLAPPPVSLIGSAASGYPMIIGLVSTAGLLGATVSGPGIPTGATVVAITAPAVSGNNITPATPGTVQLSANATASSPVAGAAFSFAVTGNAILTTGADSTATFTGAVAYSATVEIERSFDGGSTWLPYCWAASATQAKVTGGAAFTTAVFEPELQVLYRVNCTAYTSGTINYRLSATAPQLSRW